MEPIKIEVTLKADSSLIQLIQDLLGIRVLTSTEVTDAKTPSADVKTPPAQPVKTPPAQPVKTPPAQPTQPVKTPPAQPIKTPVATVQEDKDFIELRTAFRAVVEGNRDAIIAKLNDFGTKTLTGLDKKYYPEALKYFKSLQDGKA